VYYALVLRRIREIILIRVLTFSCIYFQNKSLNEIDNHLFPLFCYIYNASYEDSYFLKKMFVCLVYFIFFYFFFFYFHSKNIRI
jgi:hypothetical protein